MFFCNVFFLENHLKANLIVVYIFDLQTFNEIAKQYRNLQLAKKYLLKANDLSFQKTIIYANLAEVYKYEGNLYEAKK